MGLKVTAEQAGQLVDRHERIVRGHVKDGSLPAEKHGNAWRIDVDDLEQIPGWRIDRARLATLQERDARTAESLAVRVSTLERQLRAAETRIRLLEARLSGNGVADTSPNAPGWKSDRAPYTYPSSDIDPPETTEASYTRAYTPILARPLPSAHAGAFRDHAEAGRWLARHGVNEHTAKSWPDWRATPLTPRDVLEDAIHRRQEADRAGNWRVKWQLYQCSDAACVCHELLAN